jgi:hypothetical protein
MELFEVPELRSVRFNRGGKNELSKDTAKNVARIPFFLSVTATIEYSQCVRNSVSAFYTQSLSYRAPVVNQKSSYKILHQHRFPGTHFPIDPE